jgi:hypothetical protein
MGIGFVDGANLFAFCTIASRNVSGLNPASGCSHDTEVADDADRRGARKVESRRVTHLPICFDSEIICNGCFIIRSEMVL